MEDMDAPRGKKQLTDEERMLIWEDRENHRDKDKKLQRSAKVALAEKFGVHERTVGRIWERDSKENAASRIKSNSGRPIVYNRGVVSKQLEAVAPQDRQTGAQIATQIPMSTATALRIVKGIGAPKRTRLSK
jgi:hypothetical protein